MNVRAGVVIALLLVFPVHASGAGPADPFAGAWEARVVHGKNEYTMRLHCKSRSECEMGMVDPATQGKAEQHSISFAPAPQPNLKPARDALKYALEHRAKGSPNPEFAAMQKLLSGALGANADVDQCISLDPAQPEYFMACTVRGANARPVVLLYGSLLGLCGQGFCKHVVYPLLKVR